MATFNDPQIIDIPNHYRLISRTDTRGTILEANTEFVEISGYAASDINGQPHNILRNQEVPKAVFADMWATIKRENLGHKWLKIARKTDVVTGSQQTFLRLLKMAQLLAIFRFVNRYRQRSWQKQHRLIVRSTTAIYSSMPVICIRNVNINCKQSIRLKNSNSSAKLTS